MRTHSLANRQPNWSMLTHTLRLIGDFDTVQSEVWWPSPNPDQSGSWGEDRSHRELPYFPASREVGKVLGFRSRLCKGFRSRLWTKSTSSQIKWCFNDLCLFLFFSHRPCWSRCGIPSLWQPSLGSLRRSWSGTFLGSCILGSFF